MPSQDRTDIPRPTISDEAGEGVISTAIAVLIMAFIGAAMWVAFNGVFQGAEESISSQVELIGSQP